MAKTYFISLDKMENDFLPECKKLFADKFLVDQNDSDISEYVLEISEEWYEENLGFDTSEIIEE